MREKMRSLLLKIGWCLLGAIICIFLTNIYNYLTCSDEEKLLLEIKKDFNQYYQREELPEETGNGYINNNPNKILVRTAVIDGNIYNQQKEYHYLFSRINIGGQEKSGLSANFLINPNKVYDISYHVDKYKDDTDDFYIDKGLLEIPENAIEIVLQTGDFTTYCTYSDKYKDYTCSVVDTKTKQHFTYIYKKKDPKYGLNIIRFVNPMYKQ